MVTRDYSWSLESTCSDCSFAEYQLERVTGIEPAWPAWKAGALPLSYTRTPLARLEQV